MNKKVKLALIGAGGISQAHANGILAHQDKVECVAICDVSEDKLAALGSDLDAVDICLPHHLHAPAIFDAAAAGKHILCEKPMCINLEEADRIVEAVKKAGIIYMSAHNQLFTPALKEIKRMIDGGTLGKVRWIRSQDCFILPTDVLKGKWRSSVKYQGGGELIDTGYHPTYRLLYLAGGDVAAVRGTMARFEQEIEGEDTASVQVRFGNGVIGEILTSWTFNRPFGTHDLHVIGDLGEVFGSGNVLYHLPRGFQTPSERKLDTTDTFKDQIGCFADCVANGLRPPHGPEEGRDVLKIILKASENADGWQKTAARK
jgi:predicted dehydrogenase